MEIIQHLPAPTEQSRVETGVVQFGEDWPGVFIRGDNCMGYLMGIRALLHNLKEAAGGARYDPNIGIVEGLQKLLAGSDVRNHT